MPASELADMAKFENMTREKLDMEANRRENKIGIEEERMFKLNELANLLNVEEMAEAA